MLRVESGSKDGGVAGRAVECDERGNVTNVLRPFVGTWSRLFVVTWPPLFVVTGKHVNFVQEHSVARIERAMVDAWVLS